MDTCRTSKATQDHHRPWRSITFQSWEVAFRRNSYNNNSSSSSSSTHDPLSSHPSSCLLHITLPPTGNRPSSCPRPITLRCRRPLRASSRRHPLPPSPPDRRLPPRRRIRPTLPQRLSRRPPRTLKRQLRLRSTTLLRDLCWLQGRANRRLLWSLFDRP